MPYSPYYGRGLIQLTHFPNYAEYGNFRGFSSDSRSAAFTALGWNPDEIIAQDNKGCHDYDNCADSAGFYVVKRNKMLFHLDSGVDQRHAITASKDVNGYVAVPYLNGLEVRLQSVMYLRNVLLDEIFGGNSVPITFDWRRTNRRESVLDAKGRPMMVGDPPRPKTKFYVATHHIDVSLERQSP